MEARGNRRAHWASSRCSKCEYPTTLFWWGDRMGYAWDFSVVWEYKLVFVWGAFVTAKLTALAFVIALLIGFALALLRISESRWLRAPATFYVEVFAARPRWCNWSGST